MKKWKLLPLLLAIALVIALLPPVSLAVVAQAEENEKLDETQGLVLNKTATYDSESEDFLITLEAYVTGELFLGNPVDVVLVLDQSGSMDFCIGCGEQITNNSQKHKIYEYKTVSSVDKKETYYIKRGNSYIEVEYCDGGHGWGMFATQCDGGEGWYYANATSTNHTKDANLTPKTSTNPGGVQFYTRNDTGKTENCEYRKDALVQAAQTFVGIVEDKAKGKDGKFETDDDVDHRIAVVGFGSDSAGSNTELLSITGTNSTYTDNGKTNRIGKAYYKMGGQGPYGGGGTVKNLTADDYKNCLQNMKNANGRTMVENAIKALDAEGATQIDLGMDMAKEIFANNEATDGRQRIVVVLTDGAPTSSSDFSITVADTAISTAGILKNTYKATVYGIGLFEGADPTDAGVKPESNLDKDAAALPIACNWFMQNLSSNNGSALNPGYYLASRTSETLTKIFKEIAEGINGGADAQLTEDAIVKDIIAPQFQLPAGTEAKDITIKSYSFKGMGEDGEYLFDTNANDKASGATASIGKDGTVSVTGFDFSGNWCGMDKTEDPDKPTPHGSKLVISFHVKPKDGFLGGNDVFTNTEAKIYQTQDALNKGNALMAFPKPAVNVPIKDVTVKATDKNVYLLGGLTAEQIKSGTTVKCGNVTIDLSKADKNYGLESWQNEYVNITVTYTDKDGNTVTDLTDLKDDTTYTVTVTISPKKEIPTSTQGKTAEEQEGKGTGNINVFKPELTFKDSEVYYGDTAPESYDGNLTSTVWKHGDDTADTDKMGQAPTLDLTYTPKDGAIADNKIATKKDIPVNVTVKIGETNVTDKTGFVHTKCNGETSDPTDGKFWLHVKTCQLTIEKKAATGTAIGNDEYFVFKVYKGGEEYTQVTIQGTGSVTISELPVGSYTVTEDESVAWRYTPTYDKNSATLSKDKTSDTVTWTNTLKDGKWLNHFTSVINTYGETNDKTE